MVKPIEEDFGANLTFDLSRPGRIGCSLPGLDVPRTDVPIEMRREDLTLPELSQPEVVRYFTRLSQRNYSIDSGMYPLGSCSMKYNPRVNEVVAKLPGFSQIHPLQPNQTTQGALKLEYELQRYLAEITGMDEASLVPMAGAHGELAGVLVIRAFLKSKGENRKTILVPDSAHGTNPATAAMAGFETESIPTDEEGNLSLKDLAEILDSKGIEVAALMITQPSTLGLFEPKIEEIGRMLHDCGALLYVDGANMNALLGIVKLGDLGADVAHLNLHKTFSTPHGGGGPGAGPIVVKSHLAPFLPSPQVREENGRYVLARPESSIGQLGLFHGNFGMLVRAYTYIRSLGEKGLRQISVTAVVNANYVLARLREAYRLPYVRLCMHEVVLSGSRQKAKGVRTLDIAKRLIDYGFHPPTVYFPLIVDEALMIEPTESESKEVLDAFCDAMLAIAQEVEENPDIVRQAPHKAPLRRLDEATAARKPDLRWQPREEKHEE